MTIPLELRRLVDAYLANEADYRAISFNEAQLRQQFLNPFFEILGWDMSNRQAFSEEYKEVVHEDSIVVEGNKKAPDYCFRIGRERKFFVEAKKPSIDIKKEKAGAYQLRRYAWSAQLPFSVLTNFKHFAIFDTSIKPHQTDASTMARMNHYVIDNIEDWWDEFKLLFSKDGILRGSFQRAQAQKLRTGSSTVDVKFLEEIEKWRLALATDLRNKNNTLDVEQVNSISQLTIDRILFLRICEDRGIEPLGQLKERTKSRKKYEKLLELFDGAQRRYNSGLFHLTAEPRQLYPQDQLSLDAKIGDDVISSIISSLYFPESPYEFSVFSADVLGQVYEKFLGSRIKFEGNLVKVELKSGLKKSGGVYYTPTHIVRYIVSKSLEKILPAHSTSNRPNISILDMACGSGTFLIEAYAVLLDWYVVWHKSKENSKSLIRVPSRDGQGFDYRLTLDERKKILLDHIFGVDIDDQAVEVARLSLLLKVIEDPSVIPKQFEFDEMKKRLLPDLYENVVAGNSLISADVYDLPGLELSREEERQINAFNWSTPPKFQKILATGGFTAIIGNPPYAYRNSTSLKLKPYYEKNYSAHEGNYDLYKYFLERACSLLAVSGSLGQIVNASVLIQPQFQKLRRLLNNSLILNEIDAMGSNVFYGVTIDTAIILGTKSKQSAKRAPSNILIKEPRQPEELLLAESWQINQVRIDSTPCAVFDWRLTDKGHALVQRLIAEFGRLDDFCELSVGINTGSMRAQMLSSNQVNRMYHPCVLGTGLTRYGLVKTTDWISYDPAQIKAAGSKGRSLPKEKFFTSDKILIVRTRNVSYKRRIIATLDNKQGYNLNRLSNIVAKNGVDLFTILGFLNSTLVNWLFQTRFFNYEIKPVFLKDLPIPVGSDAKLSLLVKKRMEIGAALISYGTSQAEHARLIRQGELIEIQIDSRVIELYQLTDEEKLIAGNLPGGILDDAAEEHPEDEDSDAINDLESA